MNRRAMAVSGLALCAACVLDVSATEAATPDPDTTTLWYKQPAETWSEAMPLGDGRLGAMLFGNPAKERILINEETVWTDGPYNPANTAGAEHVAEIRRLVFRRDYARAHEHVMGKH